MEPAVGDLGVADEPQDLGPERQLTSGRVVLAAHDDEGAGRVVEAVPAVRPGHGSERVLDDAVRVGQAGEVVERRGAGERARPVPLTGLGPAHAFTAFGRSRMRSASSR